MTMFVFGHGGSGSSEILLERESRLGKQNLSSWESLAAW
jgi:hypothetical protein